MFCLAITTASSPCTEDWGWRNSFVQCLVDIETGLNLSDSSKYLGSRRREVLERWICEVLLVLAVKFTIRDLGLLLVLRDTWDLVVFIETRAFICCVLVTSNDNALNKGAFPRIGHG